MRDLDKHALVVIDVQKGFDDPYWGKRNNSSFERNVAGLIREWRDKERPLVFVRHDSVSPESPLAPGGPGNEFKEIVSGPPDLLVTKTVNSAFLGDPDLHQWLKANDLEGIVICGIQTNYCCESTARMGGNLGWDVLFALDATHTFDLTDLEGRTVTADELSRVTATNLKDEFATIVYSRDLVGRHRQPA